MTWEGEQLGLPWAGAGQQQRRWAHMGLGPAAAPGVHMARQKPEEHTAKQQPEEHTARQQPGAGEQPGHESATAGLEPELPGSGYTGWSAGECLGEHYKAMVLGELMPEGPCFQ